MAVLSTVIFTFIVGQCLKIFLGWHHYRKVNLWVFMEDGGIPSSHAVVLSSLTTALLFETGFSYLFSVSFIFSVLLLNDVMKFNKQQGIHSEFMARFIDIREIVRRKLTESIGHTPEGVLVGVLVGVVVTSLLYLVI